MVIIPIVIVSVIFLYLAVGILVADKQLKYFVEHKHMKPEIRDEIVRRHEELDASSRSARYPHLYRANKEAIDALEAIAYEVPTSTVFFWPKVLITGYIPVEKPVLDKFDDEDVNWDSPHMAKVKAMVERSNQDKKNHDPLYQKMVEDWDKVLKAYSDDFLSPAEQAMVKDAKKNSKAYLDEQEKKNPLDAPRIGTVPYKR